MPVSLVDLVLIVLALLFALSGFRQGLLVSATSIVGFLGGAVIGAQLSGPVADRIDGSSVTRVFAALVVVLAGRAAGPDRRRRGRPGAALPGDLGAGEGRRLRRRRRRLRGRGAAGGLDGRLPAGQLAVPAGGQPGAPVRAGAGGRPGGARRRALGLQQRCARRSTGAGCPTSSTRSRPTQVRDVPAPDQALLTSPVVAAVQDSVVKVSGIAPSCSRQIDGSGFVYAPERVMTNAHVLAGVADPVVHAERRGVRRDAGLRRRGGRHRRARRPRAARDAAAVHAGAGRHRRRLDHHGLPGRRAVLRRRGPRPRPGRDQRAGLPQHPDRRARRLRAVRDRPGRQLRRTAVRDRRQRARRRLRLGDRRPEHRLRAHRAAGGRRRARPAAPRPPRSAPAPASRGPAPQLGQAGPSRRSAAADRSSGASSCGKWPIPGSSRHS